MKSLKKTALLALLISVPASALWILISFGLAHAGVTGVIITYVLYMPALLALEILCPAGLSTAGTLVVFAVLEFLYAFLVLGILKWLGGMMRQGTPLMTSPAPQRDPDNS